MLKPDWITEKHIDFEYKKYTLLGYLQKVKRRFTETKLFPDYPQLIRHRNNLALLKASKMNLWEEFTSELRGLNPDELQLEYKKLVNDDALMQEIQAIIDYSIPRFEHCIQEGKTIYDLVMETLHIYPIGIVPIYAAEGYLLLKNAGKRKARVFRYIITPIEKAEEEGRQIRARYITTDNVSISNTFESIKARLIRTNPKLPNPATYVIESELELPVYETFLPVAKKILVRYVTTASEE